MQNQDKGGGYKNNIKAKINDSIDTKTMTNINKHNTIEKRKEERKARTKRNDRVLTVRNPRSQNIEAN